MQLSTCVQQYAIEAGPSLCRVVCVGWGGRAVHTWPGSNPP